MPPTGRLVHGLVFELFIGYYFGLGADPVRAVFSAVALLAGCLVIGLAGVWVCGYGCGRVLPIFGGCGWLLAGLSAS